MTCANVHDKLFVTIHYLDSFIIDYYYITMPTTAAQVNGYYWNYTLDGSNNATIGNGTVNVASATPLTPSGNIIIPSTLDGYSVKIISQYAFYNCTGVTSVTIPNSVTTIGNYTYYNCTGVTFVTIPNSVTTIGNYTFQGCTSLASVSIGTSVTSIGTYAFLSCTILTSINIPSSVTNLGADFLYNTSANLTVMIINGIFGATSPGTNKSFYGNNSVDFVLPQPSIIIKSTTAGVSSGSTTNNTYISLTFTSDQETSDFVVGDIIVTNGTLNSFSAPGYLVFTATFFPSSQGLCTIKVPSGRFTSSSQNNTDSNTFTWTYDTVSPGMTITSTTPGVTSGSTTNNTTIALTFTASASTADFVVGDISVTNGTLSPLTGSGSVYTATFTPTGQGLCTIDVLSNKFTYAAGNSNNAATRFNWTFDNISPSMTITSTTLGVTSGSIANNKFIILRFTSTEAITNFAVGDISVTNGTLSNFTGSGAVYTATFTPANEGACTIDVAAGVYTDAAGNNNLATQFTWTFSTAWNVGTNSNHLIKSYIKDFIDVSGIVVLRENSNMYISGNTETAGSLSLNRLFVTADASFNRRIFVGGDVSMNGNVAMIGDLSMNGTLTKCNFNNSSIPKSAFASTVPDGADYNTSKIVYDQTFQANDDVSMNGPTLAANNVKVSGNIVFGDGTVMNTYDNNVLTTNPKVFNASIFTALDICGNLVAGSYATSSDYRIKTNVVELDETYTVDKLRPVKYFQTQINREKYGLIAHELQEHYPDLVIGEKDGSELQRVNYTGLIAILINDIKRLKQNLAELESGI